MNEFPVWLQSLSSVSLIVAGLCSCAIALDIIGGNRQHMWIMNIVWPVTALYSGPLGLWAYFRMGRLSTEKNVQEAEKKNEQKPGMKKPFWQKAALAATHCGSGCTLGDIIAEWLIFVFPFTLFGRRIFGSWALDYAFAFALGIAFQYFTIVPMKQLPPGRGVVAALKADTLSLSAWQIGMYGWMALATFGIFGFEIERTSPVFWFMMQIAMLVGFMTSYPVNRWLLRKGIKEPM